MARIDPSKYGTPTEISTATEQPRTTLLNAVRRGEIAAVKTLGGTLLLSLNAANRWVKGKKQDER